jgi:CMP-N,N'-diacetyllegionaminic acid synthase
MLKQSDLIIYSSETLRAALERMTQNRRGVLFVCDENGHLVGALSDGDVRRSLLDDALLISTINNVMNTDPISASNVMDARELLRQLNIVAVPVIDNKGNICEVVIEDGDSTIVLPGTETVTLSDAVTTTGALAIIPARGSSKRIPRKNLANVSGKSLLAWTIQAANDAEKVSRVIVSTDDGEIADAARSMGIDVPWMRPEALATDTTPTLDVILHALNWAVTKLTPVPEFAVLLEPTAPLRKPEHIDEALSLLMNSDADCVAAVSELPHVFHPEEVLTVEGGLLKPYLPGRTMSSRRLRKDQSSTYVLNGLVYALRIHSALAGHSLFGQKTIPLLCRWEDFMDIDTPEDLEMANFKFGRCFSH